MKEVNGEDVPEAMEEEVLAQALQLCVSKLVSIICCTVIIYNPV